MSAQTTSGTENAGKEKKLGAAATITATSERGAKPDEIKCDLKPNAADHKYRLFSRWMKSLDPVEIDYVEERSARISASGDKDTPVYSISKEKCVPAPVEITVPNFQEVRVKLAAYKEDVCVAIPTFKADPKPDYGATFTALMKYLPALGWSSLTEMDLPQDSVWQTVLLPTSKDSSLTAVITCQPKRVKADTSDQAGGKIEAKTVPDPPAQLPRTVIVHFRKVPIVSGSAGLLFSTLGSRAYGAVTQQTGVNSSGAATTQNYVGLTSSSHVQFIPTGFVNLNLLGTPTLHTGFETGAGINPYGSKVKVEYFAGPAIAWHGVYLAAGVHIAQAQHLTNGFVTGEPIASGVTPATTYRTTYKTGFAISYSPPIAAAK